MRLAIATNFGQNRARQVSAERLVNMYAEPAKGKSEVVVHGINGSDVFATCSDSPLRGLLKHLSVLYAVSGGSLYSVSSQGVATAVGAVTGSGKVGMASNGTYLCIVTGAGNPGYLYSPSGGLVEITDPDFTGAETVESLDGYFIFTDGTESFFINTTPFDGTNYDALDFASAESNPDKILRAFVDHRELFLFGSDTAEIWYNTGDADFPFERAPGGITEKGTPSSWAVDRVDNTVFHLDQNGIARRIGESYGNQRISTHEVEAAFGSLADATAFTYIERGHEFFVLNFPNGTWVYDAATGLWHERKSWNENRWRMEFSCYCYNKYLLGDFESGKIYEQTGYTEDGEIILAEAIFPPINIDGMNFKVPELQLDLLQGTAGDVTLWLSNDGSTWRNAGVRSFGATGNTEARTVWRSLGQHRNLHIRFTISSAVQRAVFSAFVRLTQ